MNNTQKGLLYGFTAYTLWGLLTIFWKSLAHVPALETLSHRIVWSLIFLAVLLTGRKQWAWLNANWRNWRLLFTFFGAGCLLSINWGTYIWAVNSDFIVEASLGYFINPLVNVLLGVIIFKERLRLGQGIAIGFATAGVLYLTFSYGQLPWIGLTLAFSFGLYGVLKKRATLQALESMFLEVTILFLPALGYLLYLEATGVGQFGHANLMTNLLIPMTALATVLPLVAFAAAAPRIPLSTLGILQYMAPTLQFLIGVLIYNEAFTQARLIGFSLIWTALFIYSIEGYLLRRRRKAEAAAGIRYAS